jgi:hypothetical protein
MLLAMSTVNTKVLKKISAFCPRHDENQEQSKEIYGQFFPGLTAMSHGLSLKHLSAFFKKYLSNIAFILSQLFTQCSTMTTITRMQKSLHVTFAG